MQLFIVLAISIIVSVKADEEGDGIADFIIGGRNAYQNEFPYMALIKVHNNFVCGGALINNGRIGLKYYVKGSTFSW